MMQDDLTQRIERLEDRAALKMLVDTFSNLADRKDVERQVQLFTEDAMVDSYLDGKLLSSVKGREQIAQAFGPFLAGFQTVYHHNGQQTVELHGDHAMGVAYCLVVLIGQENGRTIKTTNGVTYDDEYVRRGHQWLIAKRVSHFVWQQREDVTPSAR